MDVESFLLTSALRYLSEAWTGVGVEIPNRDPPNLPEPDPAIHG